MARNATRFCIMDLDGSNFSNLCLFDIEEAAEFSRVTSNGMGSLLDIMSAAMYNGPN